VIGAIIAADRQLALTFEKLEADATEDELAAG
jgi:hypothetical protein